MVKDVGRVGCAETGSRASTKTASGLGPLGFDPARKGWAQPGEQVMFLGENGYEMEREKALALWAPGTVLTVRETNIGDWSSTYRFDDYTGAFNTVMFAQRATQSTGEKQ